ncbi:MULTISPECIES: hypothetical protein [unclassified Mesorhizobium]|uniref:hypothetical protein n=1 Tax=unclassified Mesorhizobium TaxID=325217 RepID=UPI0011277971|nr:MULTISPECIES: hypothetical protein [unclassified Mesorhizobium]TPJ51781.1 hypothetical protein FJ426_18930 [Mesorhizobium sp. B2-6-4]TPN42403.1 hypothetical protein FJ979_02345 [Mesorhizobium sp. B1-1-6]
MSHLSEVYWNSHKRCFSIRPKFACELEGFDQSPRGRVFYNRGPFVLAAPRFKVNEVTRQRVIRTGKKEVHATISGLPLVLETLTIPTGAQRVRYNPFRAPYFQGPGGGAVWHADIAFMKDNEVWIL